MSECWLVNIIFKSVYSDDINLLVEHLLYLEYLPDLAHSRIDLLLPFHILEAGCIL